MINYPFKNCRRYDKLKKKKLFTSCFNQKTLSSDIILVSVSLSWHCILGEFERKPRSHMQLRDVNTNRWSANHMAATCCILASTGGEDELLKYKPGFRTVRKGNLSGWMCHGCWPDYFRNSWSIHLLVLQRMDWKGKNFQWAVGWKCLAGVRHQHKIGSRS